MSFKTISNKTFCHFYCLCISISYVLFLYFLPSSIRNLNRDNTKHIKYRMIAAGIATLISIIVFILINNSLSILERYNLSSLELIGIRLDSSATVTIRTLLLMTIFYLGPVSAYICLFYLNINNKVNFNGLIEPLQESNSRTVIGNIKYNLTRYYNSHEKVIIFRNIVYAPISEEIVFRSLMIPMLYSVYILDSNLNDTNEFRSSLLYIAYICPLWFGFAHIHHFYHKITSGDTTIISAIITTLIQLTYTTIFGFIATLLFMRTGNIMGPIVSHIYCNIMGLPDIGFYYHSSHINSNELSCLYDYRYILLLLHAAGLILFSYLLFPLTESSSLDSIYWRNSLL